LRAGFVVARKSRGRHQAYTKSRPEGGHYLVILPQGEREIPNGTFRSILKQADLTYEPFLRFARAMHKGVRKDPDGS
jgi:predicted RNA binding protein YcfA (HicA-like mRNA interferase family)